MNSSRQRRPPIGAQIQSWVTEAISDAIARVPAAVWVILGLTFAVYLLAVEAHVAAAGDWWLGMLVTAIASGGYRWLLRASPRPWDRPGALAAGGGWFSLVWAAGGRWWGLVGGFVLAIAAITWWLTNHEPSLEEGEDFWTDEDGHVWRQGQSTPLWRNPDTPLPHREEGGRK